MIPRYTPRPNIRVRAANSRTNSNHKKFPWLLALGLALAFFGLVGGITWFMNARSSREPQSVAIPTEFKRDALSTAPTIEVETIFSEEAVRRFNNGDGTNETRFVISFRGKDEWVRPFFIPKQKMTADVSRPARRALVLKKINEFQEVTAEFARYQPRTWTHEVMVDDSSGIDQTLRDQVVREVDNLDIPTRLKAGDGVHFWTFRLSATDFLDSDRALAEPGEGTHAYGKIGRKLDDLLAPKPAKTRTSLATGLFNALAKNLGKRNRTVLVFTDGLENSDLGNFYVSPPKSGNQEVADKLQSKVQCPDLKGTWVYLYGPKSGANADQIRQSLSFWKWLLESKGAKVEMEY